jgi:hypothetical protein
MLEYITKDNDSDIKWKFQRIVSHEYNGSQCYLLIEWENGETTNEPLSVIAADDPVSHEYKGSQCYLLIECENGETTSELLSVIAADDPVSICTRQRPVGQTRLETVQAYYQMGKEIHPIGKSRKAQVF